MILIRVLIDADGCPVVDIAVQLCRSHHIPCLILCDTAHLIQREGAETRTFDKGSDSVDFALVRRAAAGDAVVTQDYGLAAMCLARGCRVLHQDGWEYTAENIDALLLVRHEFRKHRAAGNRMKGMKKRSEQQDAAFQTALQNLIQTAVQG